MEEKIRKLLAKYGVEEQEIENFMKDLSEMKDDEEENKQEISEDLKNDEEENLLSKENIELLKLTDEGKKLIINAPTMAKEELENAIKKYLETHKNAI